MNKNTKSRLLTLGTGVMLFGFSQFSLATEQSWYLGVGAGQAKLMPEFSDVDTKTTKTLSGLKRLIAGLDINELGSVELVVTDLGEAEVNNGDTVEYFSADVAGLYRIYDSNDWHPHRDFPHYTIFAKVGVGYIELESDTRLEQGSRAHVTAGLGGELTLFRGISLRVEAEFVDSDALASSISLVKRFGQSDRSKRSGTNLFKKPAESVSSAMEEKPDTKSDQKVSTSERLVEEIQSEGDVAPIVIPPLKPVVTVMQDESADQSNAIPAAGKKADAAIAPVFDADGDGVEDALDQCQFSRNGFPVRDNGCPLLHGVVRSIQFARYSSDLTFESAESLANIADILKEYPDAKVQLRAHTARERSESDQMDLTRARLQNMGILLRSMGITYPQVRFYSFGARLPAPFGLPQDRVEIREQP